MKIGDRIRIINKADSMFGLMGTIVFIDSTKYKIKWDITVGSIGATITYPINHIKWWKYLSKLEKVME